MQPGTMAKEKGQYQQLVEELKMLFRSMCHLPLIEFLTIR